jgi:hypothetical protein
MKKDCSKNSMLAACMLALFLLSAERVAAATIYTYTGNSYDFTGDSPFISGSYDTSMSVSGSFTLAAPLAPNTVQFVESTVLSFSFSDGRTTISNANAYLPGTAILIGTGNLGEVTLWSIILADAPAPTALGEQRALIQSDLVADFPEISACISIVQGSCLINADFAFALTPGTWSISETPEVVPLPATLPFFATGLGALGLLGWWRKRKPQAAA